jgi:hypothetical protein
MGRPRSSLGLLLYLAGLHARRRPGLCVALAALGIALAIKALYHAPVDDRGIAAAVLRDGFALTTPDGPAHRVVELDARGGEQRTLQIAPRGEIRVVGSRVGSLIGWLDAGRMHLARAGDDRDVTYWGRSARLLCEGVASNDVRFAIGWLESDDNVWIVHGPVADKASADVDDTDELLQVAAVEAAQSWWCGIASAERNVAMLWRSGDQLRLLMCAKKRCSPLAARFRIGANEAILGFGCLRASCLIATRADQAPPRLSYLTDTGKTRWTLPLAATSSKVAIVGTGDRAFAVGYVGNHGAEILRIDRGGASAPLWRDPEATSVPVLAWSSGKLVIARYQGDELVHEVLAVTP